MKRQLAADVNARRSADGALPQDHERWWMDWEHHNWKPIQPLWDDANPFVPLKHFTVSIKPAEIPPDTPVTFTVTAVDGGKEIHDADVLVGGKKVGVTGQPIHWTFHTTSKIEFDPETRHKETVKIFPSLVVTKSGYQSEFIPLG
jgi:hypothetical protein